MPTVTFEDTDQYSDDPGHNRPLFITSSIDNQPLSINILPIKTLNHLGVDLSQIRPNTLII